MTGLPDDAPPRRRSFVVKRLDRARWWPVSTEADDDEIEEVLRQAGYDPATRCEMNPSNASPPTEEEAEGGADEGGNSLVRHRWVRIMADVCADGVWNEDGEACLVEDLPVPSDLRARILTWQDWYDRDDDEENGRFDVEAFAAEGLAIARAVKAHLPDWTVVYFDESKPARPPRSTFEYEIGLPDQDRSTA